MSFKLQWAMARRAYRIAPHGFRRARLKDLQNLVTEELKREVSPDISAISTGAEKTDKRARSKIAA